MHVSPFLSPSSTVYEPPPKTKSFAVMRGLGNIFNLLNAINAAANFILYCSFSDKVRLCMVYGALSLSLSLSLSFSLSLSRFFVMSFFLSFTLSLFIDTCFFSSTRHFSVYLVFFFPSFLASLPFFFSLHFVIFRIHPYSCLFIYICIFTATLDQQTQTSIKGRVF